MQSPWIAPSILSADFARLGEEVRNVLEAGADVVHFDVMDNHYVPNLTIGPLVCEALRKAGIAAPIDVHLMVKPVDRIVPDFAKAGATWITFHPEASEHVDRTIGLIREHGCRPGLVLNPATPVNWLDHVLDKIDMVLLMSVNPGFGGQSFIPSALPKIAEPATNVSAPAAATAAMLSTFTPPSTSRRISRPLRSIISRTFVILGSTDGMNDWPPKPGFTDMSSTMSIL